MPEQLKKAHFGSAGRQLVGLCRQLEIGGVVAFISGIGRLNDPWGDLINYFQDVNVTQIKVLAELPHRDAMPEEVVAGDAVIAGAAARMGRVMPAADEIPQLLRRNFENPRWDEVAGRCLTCGNCTMVCPTCFCTTVEEVTSLDGAESERMRHWDSCFTIDFSYLHGGSVRASPRSRYRQWMTHKLSTWWDQFGTSGCVGCGRCIAWCPVGIDITEEVAAIRSGDTAVAEKGK